MIPKRPLGNTGVHLSLIGLGGMALISESQTIADALVQESIDAGVNYFDVAPTYGEAELRLGYSLKPWRNEIFLACKTTERDSKGAWKELKASLKRLQTDRIDLYQLHGLTTKQDAEKALKNGGAIETFLRAKKEGLIKYIGFSAHSPEAALKCIKEFDFDTVMYPVNFAMHFKSNFEEAVLNEAKKKGLGILALKAMAKQLWPNTADRKQHPKCWYQPVDEQELARLALYWTLSQGITAALPPGDVDIYSKALKLAADYRELTVEEIDKLKRTAADLTPVF